MTVISRSLHTLISPFSSNTYLLLGNKNILIDPGFHKEELLKTFIEDANIEFSQIDYIFLTHGHADHFINCKYFENVPTYISEHDGTYIKKKDHMFSVSNYFSNDYYPEKIKYFIDGQEFDIGSYKLKVYPYPGHTKGSVGLYDAHKKILFSGDTLFEKICGRYDMITSSRNIMINSLKRIYNLEYEVLLSGHGKVYFGSIRNQRRNIEHVLNNFENIDRMHL